MLRDAKSLPSRPGGGHLYQADHLAHLSPVNFIQQFTQPNDYSAHLATFASFLNDWMADVVLGPAYIRSALTQNLQLGYFRTSVNISN